MRSIILFAGTTEGRRIAKACADTDTELYVSVATEYGETLIDTAPNIHVIHGRKNADDTVRLIRETGAKYVIDATHPFAAEVTQMLKLAASSENTEYIRIVRECDDTDRSGCVFFDDTDAVVRYLSGVDGNILLTVGSKELARYTELPIDRMYARILPVRESVEYAMNLGFEGKHLICMQGPFSEEMNIALFNTLNVRCMVTKDTGAAGGFPEKISAAKKCGVLPLVIKRPSDEQGMSADECIAWLAPKSQKKKITIAGIGMGSEGMMTCAVKSACEKAELIIGAGRLTDALSAYGKERISAVSADDIESCIRKTEYKNILVAMSGDSGFFSGTKKLLARIGDFDPDVLPGISCISYLCAVLGTSYDDSCIESMHGRSCNIVAKIKRSRKVFVLVGGENGAGRLVRLLCDNGLGSVRVTVGENLSYENERITTDRAENLASAEFSPLAAVLVENDEADRHIVTHGRSDDDFIRGEVPMTKREVRAVTLSMLKLTCRSVCWDIGAGTGSVSVEMAECAVDGFVYAIERKAEACALIEKNIRKTGVTNISVIQGDAAECVEKLPVPTHVFIGGSGGELRVVTEAALKANPEVRIVINTVTAESFAEVMSLIKNLPVKNTEITELNVSRARQAGAYHLMQAQSPVYIIAFEGEKADA